MTNPIRIQWSEEEPIFETANIEELEFVLDQVARDADPDLPPILFIDVHGYRVVFGMGPAESFLQFIPESGKPPYAMTIGDSSAQGKEEFYLMGVHPTQVPRRNLIPTRQARQVLMAWIQKQDR
jgi:hypothetical protein